VLAIGLFSDNKKTREVYLAEEFCNVKQGNLSVGDYLNRQKAAANALAEVGAPVSDSDLVTNVIKGLDERFNSVTDIAPLLTPFPTFLNFHNMLLLQEMKVVCRTANTFATAFDAKGPAPLLQPAVCPLLVRVTTNKYRGCIVVLSINKSVEPNEEQKVLTSGFGQGFTVNTSKRVFRSIW
jgi:hypothetical protein